MRSFHLSRKGRERLLFWLLTMPSLLVLLGVGVYPLIRSLSYSFHQADFIDPFGPMEYVGMQNYEDIADDERFWNALENTAKILIFSVSIQLALGLGLALAISTSQFEARFLTTVYVLPMMVAPVVVGITWLIIYHPNIGLLNYVLGFISADLKQEWLTDPDLALPSIIVADVWQWTPFTFLIMRAAVLAIPDDIIEAARVDGAGRVQIFLRIQLPLLTGAMAVAILIRGIDVIKMFDIVWVLTGGGPGRLTENIGIYLYRTAFRHFETGYAAALSYVQFLLVVLVSLPFIEILLRRWERTI